MGGGDLTAYFLVLIIFLSVVGFITVYKHSKIVFNQILVKVNLVIHNFKKNKYQNQIDEIDKKLHVYITPKIYHLFH